MSNDQPTFEGIEDVISHVEANRPEAEAETNEKTKDSEAATEVAEVEGDDTEAEELTEEDESEAEESDEDEPEEEDESDEDDEEDFLFKIEDGDEEIVVQDVEEAKKGYLRQKDYTKKTQEVAAEKKAVEQQKGELLDLKAQYLQGLAELKASVSDKLSKFIGVDWEALQRDDPIEFEDMKGQLEAAQLAYQTAQQSEAELQNELTKETIEYTQQVRAEEMSKLQSVLPELLEDSSILDKARVAGTDVYGFSEQELLGIYDHRMIRVLVDAQKYNEMQSKLESGKAKAKTVKTTKAKGKVSSSTAKARKAKAAKAAFNRPGGVSIEEALQLLGG